MSMPIKYCLFPNAVSMLIREPTNRRVAPIEPITIAMINTELLMRFFVQLKVEIARKSRDTIQALDSRVRGNDILVWIPRARE